MMDVHVQLDNNEQEIHLKSQEQIVMNGGTSDYEKLHNKPQINDVELIGNKSFESLGMRALTNLEIEALLQ